MKKSAILFTGALALTLLGARLPAPQVQDPGQGLQYEYSVVLKLIQVHVTDKKGRPVRDLTKDDFIVTDNGQRMTVTEFETHALRLPAEEAAAPEAPAPGPAAPEARPTGRKIFLFFDFAYNNARGIVKARAAALHLLDTFVRPEDRVAVMTYSAVGGLAFHEYLTTDHAKARQAVEKIGHGDVKGRATQIEDQYWRLVQSTGGPFALGFRAEAEGNRQESKSMAQKYVLTLTVLARALRLVDGQKDFILYSTGVPNSLIYGYTPDNARYRADVGGAAGDQVLRRQNEAMYQEFGASGCTFYAFDTRAYAKETSLFTYDEQTLALGSRALTTAIDPTSIFKDDKQSGLNSLKRITDLTGGRYYSNINMYEKNLAQVQALTGTYYVLGYTVSEKWDGAFHDVKVEVRREGCRVRAQAGYYDPKPFAEFNDVERQIHLYDLALNERAFSRLPVNVPMTALSTGAGGTSRLAVLARVPAEVTAKLAGPRVELVALFFDAAGEVSRVLRGQAGAASFRGRDLDFAAGAEVEPGSYACRLVIRNLDSGLGAVASSKATVVKPPTTGLQLGTPLLLEARSGGTLIQAAGRNAHESFPWADLYPYDSSIFSPVLTELPPGVTSLSAVLPCAAAGGVAPELAVSAALVEASSGAQEPLFAAVSGRVRSGPLEILTVELPAIGAGPGTYYLHFYAEDRATGALGHAVATLVIPR